jgi:hypothetical protein
MGATSGAGTAYPSGAPEFTPGFQWGSCYSIFSFICMFWWSLFVLLPFFFLAIVFSVLPRFTDSDYPFVIVKHFLQLFLYLQLYSLLLNMCTNIFVFIFLGNNWVHSCSLYHWCDVCLICRSTFEYFRQYGTYAGIRNDSV